MAKLFLVALLGLSMLIPPSLGANFCSSSDQYLSADGVCTSCPANCRGCNLLNGQANCLGCNSGYFLDISGAVGTCQACATNCNRCKGTAPNQCVEASSGYRINLDNNTIVKCSISSCFTCSTDDICSKCYFGYFFNTTSSRCLNCGLGCSVCDVNATNPNAVTCSKCFRGYFLSSVNSTCVACTAGCSRCSENGCLECSSGYVLDGTTCKRCPSTCLTCDTNLQCTSCPSSYVLSSGTCKACTTIDANCKSCTETQCTECSRYTTNTLNRTTLNNGVCSICPANCISCDANSQCTTCNDISKLENGKCTATTINACIQIESNDNTKCKTCATGFKKNADSTNCTYISCTAGKGFDKSFACVDCQNNCASCDAENSKCFYTSTGYYVDGTAVKPCPKGCSSCTISDGQFVCSPASDSTLVVKSGSDVGYYCDSSCNRCYYADNALSCRSCISGFYSAYDASAKSWCVKSSTSCPEPVSQTACYGLTAPAYQAKVFVSALAMIFLVLSLAFI